MSIELPEEIISHTDFITCRFLNNKYKILANKFNSKILNLNFNKLIEYIETNPLCVLLFNLILVCNNFSY